MALFRVLFACVILGGVTCLPRRFLFQDYCTQDPENSHAYLTHSDNGPTDYNVDMTCKKGSIHWNFPSGTIDLHFKEDHDFTVCLHDLIGVNYLAFTDITIPGHHKAFPAFAFNKDDPNKEYCLTSIDNNLVIQMHVPRQTFMIRFSYRLH